MRIVVSKMIVSYKKENECDFIKLIEILTFSIVQVVMLKIETFPCSWAKIKVSSRNFQELGFNEISHKYIDQNIAQNHSSKLITVFWQQFMRRFIGSYVMRSLTQRMTKNPLCARLEEFVRF